MWRSSRFGGHPARVTLSRAVRNGLLGVLAAALAASVPSAAQPGGQPARAGAPLPAGLAFVPHDAAVFVHADVAALWKSDLLKSLRGAETGSFDKLEAGLTAFGVKIDELKSVTAFVPKLKGPEDAQRFGLVLAFARPFDKKKLEGGIAAALNKGAKFEVAAPAPALAVVLVGLGAEYAKPQPADADGHLTAALRDAAGGTHAVVIGSALGSLPEELRREDLPPPLRAFRPILAAQAVAVTLDVGAALTLGVRVQTRRDAQAADAEKALAAFAKLLAGEAGRELPDLEKEAATEPELKDLVTAFQAAVTAVKGAKFEVDGPVARGTLTLPLGGLPVGPAYATAVRRAQQAATAVQSVNNLKQIALALHNYHDTKNGFPPAAVCDKKGKPQLSWRVLILPYLEQNDLYEMFKLDEPWDGETNKKLLAKMPAVYAMPGKTKPGGTDTYYRVFVGNGAGWDWIMGTTLLQITDGTSNTVAVVVAADAVPWTKPDELAFDPEKDMAKLFGTVGGKPQAAMFDGSVRSFKKLPSKETINGMITKSGGEVLGTDF